MIITERVVGPGWILAGRIAVGVVWAYEGLIAKIIGFRADEVAISGSIPFLPDQLAGAALRGVGLWELLLAVWAVSGRMPRIAAGVQTATLVALNCTGLIFAPEQIEAPLDLIVKNLALLALIWIVAVARDRDDDHD